MTTLTRRVGIVRRAGKAPQSQTGLELFGSLLCAHERASVRHSVVSLVANEAQAMHQHSEDRAACITRGCLRIWVGPDDSEPLVLRPGDYLLVPAGVPHRAAALDEGVELVVARVAPLSTASDEGASSQLTRS